MTLSLQFDGVDDWLKPQTGFNSAKFDISVSSEQDMTLKLPLFFGTVIGSISINSQGFLSIDSSHITTAKINGSDIISNVTTMLFDTRVTIEVSFDSICYMMDFFTNAGYSPSILADYVKGNIYNIETYDSVGGVYATYDMATGSDDDQSGNGRNSTMYGGIWVDDSSLNQSYYLDIDGVDDFGLISSLTWDRIDLDCFIDSSNAMNKSIWSSNYNQDYLIMSGAKGTNTNSATGRIYGERTIISTTLITAKTENVHVFSGYNGNTSLLGKLYKVSMYLSGVLVANFDFTNGSLEDTTGNGNTFIVTGGTMTPDGTVLPTGTPITNIINMRQNIFKDTSREVSTKQNVYANRQWIKNSKQAIYKPFIFNTPLKQVISARLSKNILTRQDIYANLSIVHSIKQELYKDLSTDYTLRQEIMKIISNDLFVPLRQIITANISNEIRLRQELYDSKTIIISLEQQINQLVSKIVELKQEIFAYKSLDAHTRQVLIKNVTKNIPTLQQIVLTLVNYKQTLEYILELSTEEKMVIDIQTDMESDLEITTEVNFDLNI